MNMGGNNKKRKNYHCNKKIVLQASEPTDTLASEGSINTEHAHKYEDDSTSKGTHEKNITQERRTKKKKHCDNTSKPYEIDEILEEPQKIKKHADTSQNTYEEAESDTEQPKKKKKKKKHPAAEETTGKKGKKSNRQMKRERFLQRQAENELASKNQLKLECINYLSEWKHNKQNWKFMKAKQVWLYKNKFSNKFVPDESWPILLEYFQTGQGNIRKMLNEDATKIIKQMDDWTESQENKNIDNEEKNLAEEAEITKPDDTTYKRARDLIQCLQ